MLLTSQSFAPRLIYNSALLRRTCLLVRCVVVFFRKTSYLYVVVHVLHVPEIAVSTFSVRRLSGGEIGNLYAFLSFSMLFEWFPMVLYCFLYIPIHI